MDDELKDHPVSGEEILTNIQAVAKRMGKTTLTLAEYEELGKFPYFSIQIRLGSWHEALQKAGLETPRPATNLHVIEEEALIKNLDDICRKTGKMPTSRQVRYSDYGIGVYTKYYGTWKRALKRFAEYKAYESYWARRIRKDTIPAPKEGTTRFEPKGRRTVRNSRHVPPSLRYKVFMRDGMRCVICGRSPLTEKGVQLQCDHIKPWSKGGETMLYNLRTLCEECNIGKGDLEINKLSSIVTDKQDYMPAAQPDFFRGAPP